MPEPRARGPPEASGWSIGGHDFRRAALFGTLLFLANQQLEHYSRLPQKTELKGQESMSGSLAGSSTFHAEKLGPGVRHDLDAGQQKGLLLYSVVS